MGLRSCLRPLIHIFDGENVAPRDEADAVLRVVGFLAKRGIASGETITGLKTTHRDCGSVIERPGDFLRMFRDGL